MAEARWVVKLCADRELLQGTARLERVLKIGLCQGTTLAFSQGERSERWLRSRAERPSGRVNTSKDILFSALPKAGA